MEYERTSPEVARIKEESAAWVAARERGMTGEEQDLFFEWLAADPRHGEWLARHHRGLQQLKRLAQWRPEHAADPNPDLLVGPRQGRRVRWLVPALAAAAAAIVFGFFLREGKPATVEPEIALLRKVLEDGSTIDLEPDAVVEVEFSALHRDVKLIRGEAWFKVAKNPARPFRVSAAGVSVLAVGTAFNVTLDERAVAVLVTEGRVRVDPPGREENPDAPLLEAGQQVVVALAGENAPVIQSVSSSELARVLSRQPRHLEFNDTPLGQVAAEFNAHNGVKIVIVDPVLAAMPVGASLRVDNVEGFVRIVEANFDAKAERRDDVIVLGRR